ncbi:MAG TPA: fumarylacetoacetate hydrolase family protein [Cellulomonas sp.]
MRLVTAQAADGRRLPGALLPGGDRLVDLSAVPGVLGAAGLRGRLGTLDDLLRLGPAALDVARRLVADVARGAGDHPVLARADVRLLAPVTPGTYWCIGYNYRGHQVVDDPVHPDVFVKTAGAVTGPEGPVLLPRTAVEIDYEAELAVVIGRPAHEVAEADALAHVAGYTITDDVSARDWQRHGSQWVLGKSFATFGPLGPVLVTADEVPDPQALAVTARLNGEVTMRSSTAAMIAGVARLVSYLSQVVTLQPGDVIATGTPQKLPEVLDRGPRWLRDGDLVEITIGDLGTLSHRFAPGPEAPRLDAAGPG